MEKEAKIEQDALAYIKQEVFKTITSGKFSVDQLRDIPETLHQDIIFKLIEAGYNRLWENDMDKFKNVNYQKVALKLIENRSELVLFNNLDKFSPKNLNNEVAQALSEIGYALVIAKNPEKFSIDNHKEILLEIIKKGMASQVINKLDDFNGLDKEVALKLIEAGNGSSVVKHLEKFSGLDNEVALELIDHHEGATVSKNLNKFSGLDSEVAYRLIVHGLTRGLAENLPMFLNLDSKIALTLISVGYGLEVMNNMDHFDGLKQDDVAKAMIRAGQGKFVKINPDIFNDLSDEIKNKI